MWFDEKVDKLEHGNWIYKLACFLCFRGRRKLSYKELYLIFIKINEKELGIGEAKKHAMERIIKIYKDAHNGQLPEGVLEDDDE